MFSSKACNLQVKANKKCQVSFVFKYICGQVKLHIDNASAFPSVFTLYVVLVRSVFYNSPDLKKWDYTGFGLSVIPSVCHDCVSAQYLENKLIYFYQILYMH